MATTIFLRFQTALASKVLVESMLAGGIPKIGIVLCLLLSKPHMVTQPKIIEYVEVCLMPRLWNTEVPVSPKYDAVDLFSGVGTVQADAACNIAHSVYAHLA